MLGRFARCLTERQREAPYSCSVKSLLSLLFRVETFTFLPCFQPPATCAEPCANRQAQAWRIVHLSIRLLLSAALFRV